MDIYFGSEVDAYVRVENINMFPGHTWSAGKASSDHNIHMGSKQIYFRAQIDVFPGQNRYIFGSKIDPCSSPQ